MKAKLIASGALVSVALLRSAAPLAWAESAPKLTGRLAANTEPNLAGVPYRLDLDGALGSMLLRGEPLAKFMAGDHLLVQGPIRTEMVSGKTDGSTTPPATNGAWRVFMEVVKAREIQSPFGLKDPEGALLAWQQTNQYRAPDFIASFPDELEGGKRLDAWWKTMNPEANRAITTSDEEIMELLRQGLRRGQLYTLPLLRWFGNRYIWGQSPQNPEAIELMYHAADPKQDKRPDARYWAVYFGLSVVQPKTPAILRALAEITMAVDDPNDLSRIAWGVKSQQKEFLAYLEPFLASAEPKTRDKARIVLRIVKEELNAFEWAAEQARQRAQAKYGEQLPAFRRHLTEGSSQERRRTLEEISRERIYLIMDESFLEAFEACANDDQEAVRYETVRIVGEHWIWQAKEQSQKAIAQMLRLTHDPSARVRYYAVYSGLSTVRRKSEPVVRRLVEMLGSEPDRNISQRIAWGFQMDKEFVTPMLKKLTDDSDTDIAKAAKEAYRTLTVRER